MKHIQLGQRPAADASIEDGHQNPLEEKYGSSNTQTLVREPSQTEQTKAGKSVLVENWEQ